MNIEKTFLGRPVIRKFHIIICFLAIAGASACVQQQPTTENLQSFHEFKLQNGITVIVRQNPLSRMHSIVLGINGGAGTIAPQKAGLDKIALQLMCMASERYPDTTRREILKRTSSVINARSDLDFATIQMQTIDTYFTETFDLFLNLIMQPAFPAELFQETVTNTINAYRSDMTDGYARASLIANQALFTEHPYQASIETPATLKSLALQDVQNFYRHTLVAKRLTVFASGKFNLDALKNRLNTTIGLLPTGAAAPAVKRRFSRMGSVRLLLDTNTQLSPEVSYLRGNFTIAPPNHSDYWALELSGKMLSDIMNDILRTRNGLVYSTWSVMYNKKTNYGSVAAYRTSDPLKTMERIHTAIDIITQGNCVSPYSQEKLPGTYIEIDKALGFYKTAFSTEYYSGIQENAAVALRMAAAHYRYGNSQQFLHNVESVNQISAKDIVRVVKRYLKKDRILWALSAHPDTITDVIKAPDMPASATVTLP